MDKIKLKAINFDLSQDALKKHYPKSRTNAYSEIESEMKKLGFEHRQGSGYISQKPLSQLQVTVAVQSLVQKLPWLAQCVEKFDVTDVGETFDYRDIIQQEYFKTQQKESVNLGLPEEKDKLDDLDEMDFSQSVNILPLSEQIEEAKIDSNFKDSHQNIEPDLEI